MRYKPLSASISQLSDSSSYDTGRTTCASEAEGRCKGLNKAWADQPAEPGSAELSTLRYKRYILTNSEKAEISKKKK